MYRYFPAIVAALGLGLFAARAAEPSAPIADPAEVHFSKAEEVAKIRVLKDGKPLRSKYVRSVRALIGQDDYSHQFHIGRSSSGPAIITLGPKPGIAQAGAFTLVISTKYGDALVAVDMTLDRAPAPSEEGAKKAGAAPEEPGAKQVLPLPAAGEAPPTRLPKWEYVGSLFTLRLPEMPGRSFTWKVDGTVVIQGKDENAFKYVLDKAGDRRIDLEIRDGDTVVARWSGILQVLDYPEMSWQVRKSVPFELRGPKDFKTHDWSVDGHSAGDGKTLHHTFKEAGEHTIQCKSTDPMIGDTGEFRIQTWKTLVK